jgi:hypothetical protein
MKAKTYTIEIVEDNELVKIEIDRNTAEHYKKETGHKRVTKRGLSKYIKGLMMFFRL